MAEGDVVLLKHKFRLMDLDDNGYVNYYEFMTQEACLKLAARHPVSLEFFKFYFHFYHIIISV